MKSAVLKADFSSRATSSVCSAVVKMFQTFVVEYLALTYLIWKKNGGQEGLIDNWARCL
jgi:hypothetical protein